MASSNATFPHEQPLLGRTVQAQCLHNSDLLDQILRHLLVPLSSTRISRINAAEVKAMRQTLHAAVLSSRFFSHCALRLLWRRLDNLLPLLRLLPSFQLNNGVYNLAGLITDADWAVFDRHALFVQEICSSANVKVDPSVYIRLVMHRNPLLPDLRAFDCRQPGASEHEMLLYASPALVSVALYLQPSFTVGAFLSVLSTSGISLTTLFLGDYVSSALSLCTQFRNLHSVTLGFAKEPITTADFAALGSLPSLQCLTTFVQQWDEIHFPSLAPGSLFRVLTHLKIRGDSSGLLAHTATLLDCIGAPSMASLVVDVQGFSVTPHRAPIFAPLSDAIRRRWTASLQHLQMSGAECTGDEFAALPSLPNLRTLSLRDVIQCELNDARVLTHVRAWANVTSLSIQNPVRASSS
ncbi:hypothetical protein C8R46DRAFT_371961 [Mycena filopes]|nr:hypothetical protein C8R46DRAFT_371961 [Mycena filopes]